MAYPDYGSMITQFFNLDTVEMKDSGDIVPAD
jgi:hypothetical protein